MMLGYYIHVQLFQIFTQSIVAIDVTSVTLSRLNSINAIEVPRYLGDIFGISLGRPAQLAELPRSKFDPELFPHSAYVKIFVTFATKVPYLTFCDKM